MLFMSCMEFRFYPCEIQSFAVWLFVCRVRQLRQVRQVIYHRAVRPECVCNLRRFCFCFLGAAKHLYKRVRPSVGPLRLLIFGGFGVLRSTAWPVLDLVGEASCWLLFGPPEVGWPHLGFKDPRSNSTGNYPSPFLSSLPNPSSLPPPIFASRKISILCCFS